MREQFEIGQEVSLEVIAISGETIFLDLNAKTEGIISTSEFLDKDGNVVVKEGDIVSVFFVGNKNGELHFAKTIHSSGADTALLQKAYEAGIPVEGSVSKEIKGGYEISLGDERAFCPYSQMGFRQKNEVQSFVGKHLSFKITEYKNNGKNILVSNRAFLEEEHKKMLDSLAQKLTVGSEVEARVGSLQKYGAFVDVGGIEALLPASEISYAKNVTPDALLKIGDVFRVKVISVDWKNERISVSKKALEEDPALSASERYKVGQKYNGVISKIAPYGIFVELESGVSGLLHISEINDVTANTNLSKKFRVGDAMSVLIKSIDKATNKISLSSTTSKEQDETAHKYMQSQSEGDTYNPFASLLK